METAPIQVVLNADNFRRERQTKRPAGAGTDFFLDRNAEFERHRSRLTGQVSNLASQLANDTKPGKQGAVGYARVAMRPQAWAKSHRPTQKIFPPHITPVVGAESLGEIICRVTPDALEEVNERIAKAEGESRTRIDSKTNRPVPAPTRYRCEVSAIESIELWDRSKRRRFAIDLAIDWLARPGTGHGYIVELFERPPPRSEWDTLPDARRQLFSSFFSGLRNLELGDASRVLDPNSPKSLEYQIRMVRPSTSIASAREFQPRGSQNSEYISDPDLHEKLLGFLETHPLVREIRLPSRIVQSSSASSESVDGDSSQASPVPSPKPGASYPKVGVIDGGIASQLDPWVTHRSGLLDISHASFDHGTFIAGLLVGGATFNPTLGLDPDGCELADLDVFPDDANPYAFDAYYPNGSTDFFDEVEQAITACREQHGTRVFNLSINAVTPAQLDRYSIEARRLDEIAERRDVLIVVSAGNLGHADMRAEWPTDPAKAAAILAAKRDDGLFVPAESVRNLSVAALNPLGVTSCIPEAPARYSRRGPGLETGLKPDLCHFGGTGTHCPKTGTGLVSLSPSGTLTADCGTSYAAPLVAKTLASLDHLIEGDVSRETLIALAIHSAITPKLLKAREFRDFASQLVGFGRPVDAGTLLGGSPHEITMLFSSRITAGKMLEFRFTWPPSLVGPDGKCRGDVKLTLVSTPPLDYRFGPEFIRVNVDAALQQENAEGRFLSALEPTHVFFTRKGGANERELINQQLKWAPTKAFAKRMTGRGVSSNWRLAVNYLERSGVSIPDEGVPFSVLVTIRDPKNENPVFQEMRQTLESTGIRTADIRTAARISARV